MQKQIVFIINPVAGVRRKHKIPDKIERFLDKRRYAYDIVYTQGRGHATELASEAAGRGIDIVAIAGGDGSVNEAAAGLVGTQTALAILPLGSGNGLARHLGYSQWMPSTLEVINNGVRVNVDVGKVNGELFFSLIGLGFDAFSAKIFDREHSRGLRTYALAAARALTAYQGFDYHMQMWTNENSEHKSMDGHAFMLNICNANQYGYNFRIAPDASVADGLLDMVLLNKYPKWKTPELLWQLFKRTHLKSKYVQFERVRKIRIESPQRVYLQIDGETRHKATSFDIEILAEKLLVLVRPNTSI